jgi:cell wall assembly regulator SMI1
VTSQATVAGKAIANLEFLPMHLEQSNPYGSIDPVDLVEFEETNEVSLPDDYKDFLLEHNGGRPEPNELLELSTDVQWLYGMVEEPAWASFFHALDTYEGRIPAWYIPIGTDSGGNIFILSLFEENKGVVALWWHEDEAEQNGSEYFDNLTHVADSFSEFITLLTPYHS